MIELYNKLKDWIEAKLPKPLRNFYAFTAVLFVLWMIFIDVDRLPRQWRKYSANQELKEEVNYYGEKISKGNQELKGLQDDKEKLERFAREKYYMHKETEDVYVIDSTAGQEE